MKTLIIKNNYKSIFFGDITNVPIYKYYCKNSLFFKLAFKYNLLFIRAYVGEWLSRVSEYDTVILFDHGYCNVLPGLIKRQNPEIRVILWFWNPVTEYSRKFLGNKYVDEFWTYNPYDAQKYGLHYNTQFFYDGVKLPEHDILWDVVYLGTDKGREKEILRYQQILDAKKLDCCFRIVKTRDDYLSYHDYLELIAGSKCIFEYVDSPICGLTLRAMESLFLEKKLITNNQEIVNYDFYHPDNIFVLGKDNVEGIGEFIQKPYQKINQDVVAYYNFTAWLDRFDRGGRENENEH